MKPLGYTRSMVAFNTTAWRVVPIRAAFFLGLWLALTGLELSGLVFGAIATIGATALSVRLLPSTRFEALRRTLPMLPGFLWHALLGGIDVARRAFDPRLPLAPTWRRVRCDLPSGGRFIIGSEFSLMPGTLIAGCRQGCYLVHLLDGKQPISDSIACEEQRLGRAMASMDPGSSRPEDRTGDRNDSPAR